MLHFVNQIVLLKRVFPKVEKLLRHGGSILNVLPVLFPECLSCAHSISRPDGFSIGSLAMSFEVFDTWDQTLSVKWVFVLVARKVYNIKYCWHKINRPYLSINNLSCGIRRDPGILDYKGYPEVHIIKTGMGVVEFSYILRIINVVPHGPVFTPLGGSMITGNNYQGVIVKADLFQSSDHGSNNFFVCQLYFGIIVRVFRHDIFL